MDKYAMYEKNSSLVPYTVNKSFQSLLSDEDAMQEARLGLWKAILAYDPSRGFKLSTVAVPYIRVAVYDYLHSKKRTIASVSLDEALYEDEHSPELIDTIGFEEDNNWLADFSLFVNTLDEEQRLIMEMRIKGYTDKEISEVFRITRAAASMRREKMYNKYIDYLMGGITKV